MSMILPLNTLIKMRNWSSATKKLASNPKSAAKARPDGYLPIHFACECGAPQEFIQALIDAFPLSIHATTWIGRTPFDLAQESYPRGDPHFDSVIDLLEGHTPKTKNTEAGAARDKDENDDLFCGSKVPLNISSSKTWDDEDTFESSLYSTRCIRPESDYNDERDGAMSKKNQPINCVPKDTWDDADDALESTYYSFVVPSGIGPGDRFPITIYHLDDGYETFHVVCPTDKMAGDSVEFVCESFIVPKNVGPNESFIMDINNDTWMMYCPSNKMAGDIVRFVLSFPPSGFPPSIANQPPL